MIKEDVVNVFKNFKEKLCQLTSLSWGNNWLQYSPMAARYECNCLFTVSMSITACAYFSCKGISDSISQEEPYFQRERGLLLNSAESWMLPRTFKLSMWNLQEDMRFIIRNHKCFWRPLIPSIWNSWSYRIAATAILLKATWLLLNQHSLLMLSKFHASWTRQVVSYRWYVSLLMCGLG